MKVGSPSIVDQADELRIHVKPTVSTNIHIHTVWFSTVVFLDLVVTRGS